MQVSAIAIIGENRVLGDGADQPFKFAADWARFKCRTLGHPLIMGRRTFAAIGLLPRRSTIVVSRNPEKIDFGEPKSDRAGFAVGSIEVALAKAAELDDEQIFVAGGGEIYRLAWPYLTEIDLTEVHAIAAGTVFFPQLDSDWREVSREAGEEFDFVRYQRTSPAQSWR